MAGTGLGIDFSPHPRPAFRSASSSPARKDRSGRSMRPTHEPSHMANSSKAMAGLLLAETGASMVEMHKVGATSFKEGRHIGPASLTPMESSSTTKTPSRGRPPHRRGISLDQGLPRHGTLLNLNATPSRRAEELKTLLGNGSSKVKSGAIITPQEGKGNKKSADTVSFEQGRSKMRVAIDMDLENNVIVEGGYISGIINLRVRPKKLDSLLHIGCGKMRIAGFEVAPGNETQHIFYQYAVPLMDVTNDCDGLYMSSIDKDGFGSVIEGDYTLNFSMHVPEAMNGGRPRGILNSKHGVSIRYIVIVSVKVVEPSTGKRSIAHFYRDCEVWPAHNPSATLALALEAISAQASKSVFMGGDGAISLKASIRRHTWIANQPVHVSISIDNATRKTVRTISLELIRTMTTFKLSARALATANEGAEGPADVEADMTGTKERKIAESVLIAGPKSGKGHASAKGFWTGVESGKKSNVVHSLYIPPDALTISRARLVEVDYTVRVSLGVGSITGVAEAVHVGIPIRIINFISLDPPPSEPLKAAVPKASVIGLNTPKANLDPNDGYPSKGVGGPRKHRRDGPKHPTSAMGDVQPEGCLRTAYQLSQASRSGNMSDFSTSSSLSSGPASNESLQYDMGNAEDAEGLDCILGDIPGSTSILEETDISFENGIQSGYDSESDAKGGHGMCNGNQYQYAVDDMDESVELQRMVGYASANPGEYLRTNQALMDMSITSQDSTLSSVYDSSGHELASLPSNQASRIRGPRVMAPKPNSPIKPNFVIDAAHAPMHGHGVGVFQKPSYANRYQQTKTNKGLPHIHQTQRPLPSTNSGASPQHKYKYNYSTSTSGPTPWTDSESDYSPSSMTPSSGNLTDSGAESQYSEADTTPIPSQAQTMGMGMGERNPCSRGKIKTMMRAGGGGNGERMKMSNVKARVAKYEQQRQEDIVYTS